MDVWLKWISSPQKFRWREGELFDLKFKVNKIYNWFYKQNNSPSRASCFLQHFFFQSRSDAPLWTDHLGFELGVGGGGGFILLALEFARIFPQNNPILSTRNKARIFTYPTIPSVVYLCGFHTRYLHSVSRQPSPRSKFSPSRPMTLMRSWLDSQSLPLSSASSVMVMCHSIALGGLAHKKNSLTLQCFLTWNSNQSDKISPDPYPLGFHTKQVSHSPTDRSGPGLTTSKTASFFFLFFFRLHWLENETLAGTF